VADYQDVSALRRNGREQLAQRLGAALIFTLEDDDPSS